jgi:hypothetical protein
MNWDEVLESNILAGVEVSISPSDVSSDMSPFGIHTRLIFFLSYFAERVDSITWSQVCIYADRNSASEDAMQRLQNPAVSSPRI